MDKFMSDLPALVATIAVLALSTALIITGHASFSDLIPLISIPVSFWFMGKAYAWQPPAPPPTDSGGNTPLPTDPKPIILPNNKPPVAGQ